MKEANKRHLYFITNSNKNKYKSKHKPHLYKCLYKGIALLIFQGAIKNGYYSRYFSRYQNKK